LSQVGNKEFLFLGLSSNLDVKGAFLGDASCRVHSPIDIVDGSIPIKFLGRELHLRDCSGVYKIFGSPTVN